MKMLEAFLPKLVLHSQGADIYVVDNLSSDDSVAYLGTHFREVKVIQNDKNHGFAKGYNVGLKNITAELLVLLNSDVEVTPDWLSPIVEEFKKDKKLSIAQPKILDYNHRNSI